MPEDILQELIVGLMLPFVNKFLLWTWKRVTRFYTNNPDKFIPFVLAVPVLVLVSDRLPHGSDLFQIALFMGVLGLITIFVGITGIVIESQKIIAP